MAVTPDNNYPTVSSTCITSAVVAYQDIYYFYIFVRVQAHLGTDMRCAWGLHTRKSDIIMLKVHEVVHNDCTCVGSTIMRIAT